MVETKVLTDLGHQPAHVLPHRRRDRTRHIAFIREIQLGLDHRARMDDPRPPTAVERALQSTGAGNGKAPLSLRFRGDEIGERLGLDQIHLAVQERAPRELTRLGRTHLVEGRQQFGHRRNDGTPAMQMELDAIFAGETGRAGEKQCQAPVDGLALRRAKPCQDGPAIVGYRAATAVMISRALGPETRMTATPEGGLPLDSAKMVSGNCI